MKTSSFIRKMFEQGLEMKKKYGGDKVFDFSLGNPNLEPPEAVRKAFLTVISDNRPGKHAYMPNAGLEETRRAVASNLSEENNLDIPWENIIMTCGAGGGLNVSLKALFDPGDEAIILNPYFVEYLFYVNNHNGLSKIAKTNEDFSLNLKEIEKAITKKTKAIIINSPNNPSGKVYDEKSLRYLADLLLTIQEKNKRPIYLLSDGPYSKIVYDGIKVPSIFQIYPHSLFITSYSKDLSLPGERIGYIAVNPKMENASQIVDGLTFCNRILGFVNAPAFMQRILPYLQGVTVNVSEYQKKRDLLCEILSGAGYSFIKPEGAFYLFPQTPIADDRQFVQILIEEKILAVPGIGFGSPGHFRLAYCVDDKVIERSAEGFKRAFKKYFSQ